MEGFTEVPTGPASIWYVGGEWKTYAHWPAPDPETWEVRYVNYIGIGVPYWQFRWSDGAEWPAHPRLSEALKRWWECRDWS